MLLSKTLLFYKRKDVQTALVEYAKDKEVAIRFGDYFGKRPDALMYEADVLELAKKKMTSLHCSEELWINPLSLRSEIKKQEMDELRKGWDLILDIDCHHFTYSQIAAHLLVKILKDLDIKSITCKFSGNKGFHLAIPFEAFPQEVHGKQTKDLFPEAPRKIAFYLRDKLRPLFEKAIMQYEKGDINNIVKRTGIEHNKLVRRTDEKAIIQTEQETDKLIVDEFLEIDTVLIASRHLYRMPYSLHEKSELVSVPVDVNKILKFRKKDAEIQNVKVRLPFLERTTAKKEEAKQLFINAYDFSFDETKTGEQRERKEYVLPENAIKEEFFPPCMNNILNGLKDGKKRALFTLINFLKGAGWTYENIKEKIHDWNKKNPEPLKEVYLNGQLRQIKKTKEIMPPHNCKRYYQDLQVCSPDSFCNKIKNPLQYTKLKEEIEKNKKGIAVLSDEQKTARNKNKIIAEQILEIIKPHTKLSKASVLDIGCGAGKKGRYIASKAEKYIGIDSNEQRIEIAKATIKNKKAKFQVGNAQELNFKEKFDIITYMFTWHMIKNHEKALNQAIERLNENGIIVIAEPTEQTTDWSYAKLRKDSADYDEQAYEDKIEEINSAKNKLKNLIEKYELEKLVDFQTESNIRVCILKNK